MLCCNYCTLNSSRSDGLALLLIGVLFDALHLPPPESITSPYDKQIHSHAYAILYQIHLATFDFSPLYRYFPHFHRIRFPIQQRSDDQDLNVEDPPFDMHVWEDLSRYGTCEELEAALGVCYASYSENGEVDME